MDSIVNFFMGFVTAFNDIQSLGDLGRWLFSVVTFVGLVLWFLFKIGIDQVNWKKFFLAGITFGVMALIAAGLGAWNHNLGMALLTFGFFWLAGIPFRAYADRAEED